MPLVSVIIPTYKRSDRILDTIDSVIKQSYSNIEIIVVDDNGEGTVYQIETEKRLKNYICDKKIIYLKHPVNKNGSAARNTGFRTCKGDYINFLDDDDYLLPSKIEEEVARLENSTEIVGAVYCNSITIYKQNITNRIKKSYSNCSLEGNVLVPYLLGECTFNTSAILFKRSTIESLNGFDETWRRHQDYELMARFFQKYEIVCCSKEPLMIYDVSGVRINVSHGHERFIIEKRFLDLLASCNVSKKDYERVAKKIWYSFMYSSLIEGDRNTYNEAENELEKVVSLSFIDKFRLLKAYPVRLLLIK